MPLVQVVALVLANGAVTVTAGLLSVSAAPVLLLRVTLVRALVVPTACAGNATVLGVSTTRLVPVPVMPTSCGLLGSLSLMINAPFFAPVVFGLNTTLMSHFAPAANALPDAGQVLALIVKSVSLTLMLPIVMLAVLLLVTATVLAALVVFTAWLPKFNGPPVMESPLPVPVNVMMLVLLKKPLSSIVMDPVAVPADVGVKNT